MEFIAGVCPQCGGEIKLDPQKSSGYCMHCGVKIYTKDALKPNNRKDELDNYVRLAKESIDSVNREESLLYANKALEIDSKNPDAWFVKMQVSQEPIEIINCANNVIEFAGKDKQEYVDKAWNFLKTSITNKMDVAIAECAETTVIENYFKQLRAIDMLSAPQNTINVDAQNINRFLSFIDLAVKTFLETSNFKADISEKDMNDFAEVVALRFIKYFKTHNSRLGVYKANLHETAKNLQKELFEKIVKDLPDDKKNELRNELLNVYTRNGGCYIATAVYGSYNNPQVMILRNYRDEVLQKNYFGQLFIKIYYLLSPPLANKLKYHKKINRVIKNVLDNWIEKLKNKYKFIL